MLLQNIWFDISNGTVQHEIGNFPAPNRSRLNIVSDSFQRYDTSQYLWLLEFWKLCGIEDKFVIMDFEVVTFIVAGNYEASVNTNRPM